MYIMDPFHPAHFHSDGTLQLNGQTVSYRTVSEDNVFYDDSGNAIASVFSFSYFRNEENPSDRPVLFCFNGGPGSSSMLIHAGCFGTKRIAYPESVVEHPSLPPYKVIDNPNCLLDAADLVMVDPVGTGFARLLDPAAKEQFLGIEADAEALVVFIQHWLTKYHRWNSPRYLVGESYGCTRAVTAAAIACSNGKKDSYHLAFNGIICIGNTITTASYFNRGIPVEYAVEALPTMAAIHWYHHLSDSGIPLEEFVSKARQFADHDYLIALHKGIFLTDAEKAQLAEQLMYYTGVSEEYLEKRDFRLERISFCKEVLRKDKKVVSVYDGRFARQEFLPQIDEESGRFFSDASMARYGTACQAALHSAILPALGIHDFDRVYIASTSYGSELEKAPLWNFETERYHSADRLSFVMNAIPGMRLMFINGYYDLCTQTGVLRHTLSHAHVDPDRIHLKEYPSGHMAYIGEENVRDISNDIREFICKQPIHD